MVFLAIVIDVLAGLVVLPLALLLVMNAAAKGAFAWRQKRRRKITPFLTYDQLRLLERAMPGEEPGEIINVVKTFSGAPVGANGESFRLHYDPFVEHKDAPFCSRYLNITAEGIRLNRQGDCKALSDAAGSFLIFGNSTIFGYSIKDSDTIPAYVEAALQGPLPGARVFNCARQSYFSTMEVILFLKFIHRGARDGTAVFMDGLNDVFHNFPVFRNRSRFSEHIEGLWNKIDYIHGDGGATDPRSVLLAFWQKMPAVILGREIARRLSARVNPKKIEPVQEFWARGIDQNTVDCEQLASRIAHMTDVNWEAAIALGRSAGFKVFVALQPLPYFDCPPNPFLPSSADRLVTVYQLYYDKLKAKWGGRPEFIDLSQVLLAYSGQAFLFCDKVHYSPISNKIIGDALAQHLLDRA